MGRIKTTIKANSSAAEEVNMEHLTVLIGESDDVIVELLTNIIQAEIGDTIPIKVLGTHKGVELPGIAEVNPIDLFVPILNNLVFPGGHHKERALRLVTYFKKQYGIPIIAMAGPAELAGPAKEAGADYFFKMPFGVAEFQEAVRRCLMVKSGEALL